jgi:hypothetical protein
MARFDRWTCTNVGLATALAVVGLAFGCQSISGLADYREGTAVGDAAADAGSDVNLDSGSRSDGEAPPEGSDPAQWAMFRLACGADEGCSLREPVDVSPGNVTDPITGLAWIAQSARNASTFQAAITACGANRLPTRIELISILRRKLAPNARGWQLPPPLKATEDVFWTASVAYPIDPVRPKFWFVNRVTAETGTGLPDEAGQSEWAVLCILGKK